MTWQILFANLRYYTMVVERPAAPLTVWMLHLVFRKQLSVFNSELIWSQSSILFAVFRIFLRFSISFLFASLSEALPVSKIFISLWQNDIRMVTSSLSCSLTTLSAGYWISLLELSCFCSWQPRRLANSWRTIVVLWLWLSLAKVILSNCSMILSTNFSLSRWLSYLKKRTFPEIILSFILESLIMGIELLISTKSLIEMLFVGLYACITSASELLLSKARLFWTLSEIFSPSSKVIMNSSSFLFAKSICIANLVLSCLFTSLSWTYSSFFWSASSKILLRSLKMIWKCEKSKAKPLPVFLSARWYTLP